MKRHLLPSLGISLLLLSVMLSASAADSVQVTPLPPVEHTDERGGVCFSYYPGNPDRPYLPLTREAGSRWDRFDFIWPNIEQSDNGWHFDGYDDLVQDMGDAGMNTVGILLWTPTWAATRVQGTQTPSRPAERPTDWYAPSVSSPLAVQAPPGASDSPPKGLSEEWDDWTTSDGDPINYWGRYVHKVVSRYSDPSRFPKPVKHWEMWNEVDDDAIGNYFWTGSEADYAQLLKVGYQATKDACPDCTVLYAGLLYWGDKQYFERVLDILNDDPDAAENNYYFDVMSLHLYSRSSTAYDTVNRIRSRMKQYVSDHPIWLTETGVMVWDDASVDPHPDKYDFAATEEEAASYVIQSYANAWASGVERYFFFRANDEDMSEYFGMMRNDQSFRPSYVAYQVARNYLVGPTTMVTNWTYETGVRRVTLWGTPRGKISVLWNTDSDPVAFDYPATLSTATLVDQRGAVETAEAGDGAYGMTLPGATANLVSEPDDYFIGGEPYVVIEEDTTAPGAAAVQPLPATTYSHTIPVAWEASDAEAGIWGYDVQVREDGGGWTGWLTLAETMGEAGAPYTEGGNQKTYCFRARAWDRAGNLGPWSDGGACTTLDTTQQVQLSVGSIFGDEDEDGEKTGEEPSLANVTFRLLDEGGQEIGSGSGGSWSFVGELEIGTYTLMIYPEGWPSATFTWLPRGLPVSVRGGGDTLTLDHGSVGLVRHRASSYMPLVGRSD